MGSIGDQAVDDQPVNGYNGSIYNKVDNHLVLT